MQKIGIKMREILLSISVCAIITAVFKILVPENQNGKQVRILLSCFFIVSVMNIFGERSISDEFLDIFTVDTAYTDFTDDYEKQVAGEAADSLSRRIEAELIKENIRPEKIYVNVNISENSSISFNEIRLVLGETAEETAERAVEITKKYTGNEIEVYLEEPQ